MSQRIVHAGNTLVPAILALETLGYAVSWGADLVSATSAKGTFVAADPVSVLGLIKLVEIRSWEWGADDSEIDTTLEQFRPYL
jgi:hypothetical protein